MDPLDFPVMHTDRGLTLGLGLFETILVIDGVPVMGDRHMKRLREGCQRLGWTREIPDLSDEMVKLIELNDLASGRARLRLSVTAGSGLVHRLEAGGDQVMWMHGMAVAEPPSSTTVMRSVHVRNERSLLAGLKCASYAENVVALAQAARLGFEETLFANTVGDLCEAATANVFLVKDGVLITPALESGCLPGITRETVIELAAQSGIGCEVRRVRFDEVDAADEVFLTSSIRGVMGVARVGERELAVGPITNKLSEAWISQLPRKTSSNPHV